MSKYLRKNEFRFNYNTKHKNYVFEELDDKFHSVGLTHENTTFGRKNMPLSKNPQKGKTDKAYVRNGIIVDKKKNYGKPLKNYGFDKSDFKNVKSKIRNYKSKRKSK